MTTIAPAACDFCDILAINVGIVRKACREGRHTASGTFGFDHGVGHPLLLLYDAKTPRGQKVKEFNGL
jgi:hypothetical protein